MTDIFTQGIIEDLDRRQSGQAFDIEVDQFGVPRYVPKADMMQPFEGAQDQTDPFAIAGEVTPTTPAEFAEKTFEVGVGAVGGTVATAIGTLGDFAGAIKGVADAIGAEEGKGFEAFLTGLSSVSSIIGSERTIGIFEDVVNALPLDEESRQNVLAGSKYFGEVAGVPVGGQQLTRAGLAAFKALTKPAKPPAMAPRVPSAGMIDVETEAVKNMLPFESIPKRTNISEMERDEWQQLSSELKISQPIITPGDAVDAAQRNQKMLAKAGPEIAAATGASFKNPGIKGAADRGKRMAEKAKQKGGIQQLTDVTRAGFSVANTKTADDIVDLLEQRPEFKIIDEGYNVTPQGYFDRKILIVNPDGQVGEVQIAPKEIWRAKYEQGGEDLYGIARSQQSTPEQVAKAIQDSVELYSSAINRLDDDFVQIARNQLQSIVEKKGKDAEQAQMVLDKLRAAQ